MKATSKKLLKEMYLFQTAGAGDSMDEMIALAVDVYCELNGVNKEQFLIDHKDIKDIVWSGWDCSTKEWERRQRSYEKLLNQLLEVSSNGST